MIYFARAGSDGPVKIGWSKNVTSRIAFIQPTMPIAINILRVIDAEPWVERWFHQRFSHLRLMGEWFTFDAAMLMLVQPTERPILPPLKRGRPLTLPDLIQVKAPAGTRAMLLQYRLPGETETQQLRRALAEWLAAQKKRRAA